MKKLTIISIYLAFGIALMRVAGVPAPSIVESFMGMAIPASSEKETPAAAFSITSIATTTTVTWATWTATTTGVATGPATYTTGVWSLPFFPLLDRLVKNRPSIWGNKGFYILLGALYLTLLGLFLKQILDTLKRQP